MVTTGVVGGRTLRDRRRDGQLVAGSTVREALQLVDGHTRVLLPYLGGVGVGSGVNWVEGIAGWRAGEGGCSGRRRWGGWGGKGWGGGGWEAAIVFEGSKDVRSERRESRSKSVSGAFCGTPT